MPCMGNFVSIRIVRSVKLGRISGVLKFENVNFFFKYFEKNYGSPNLNIIYFLNINNSVIKVFNSRL